MMRQAGRYMKIYRDLRDKYPSPANKENPDLSYEISMQPFHAFKPDGVILFSDILTPLPGMGIDFDIIESKGLRWRSDPQHGSGRCPASPQSSRVDALCG